MSPTLDDDQDYRKRLQNLRAENDKLWQRVEDLHCQWESSVYGDASNRQQHPQQPDHPSHNMLRLLQTELDLLPQNSVYAECDTLLEQIESCSLSKQKASPTESSGSQAVMSSAEMEDSFAAEVVDSFQHLLEANAVLYESIAREQNKLQVMQKSVAEHTEIHNVLQEMMNKQMNGQETTMNDEDNPERDGQAEQELLNEQLRNDLQYVVGCVEEQQLRASETCAHDTSTTSITFTATNMSLDELVLKLLDRLLSSPDFPYVSVEGIEPNHVELLKKCWIIQTFEDDESMIRLLDYQN